MLAPFRFREYRLLIAAVSVTIFAEGMWAVVMVLQVIALDDNPTSLSLVATCLGVGLVAFVLVGGLAADRLSQRSIIIAVEIVNTAAVASVAFLGLTGALRIWHMAVAAATLGIAAAFFFPAYSALLPRILPAEQLLAANGVEGVVRPVFQRAVGPAVAGVLVGATFPALGAGVVAGLFGVGLLLLLATTAPVQTVVDVLLPFVVQDRFTHGAQTYGFVLAFFGVGSAVGALGVSSRPLPRRYLSVMMAMWGAGSLPLAVLGVTSSFPVMAGAAFVIGVTDGAGMVIWGTLLQRRVPAAMLGRVSSLDFFVSLVFMPVSFAIVGPLSNVVSMEAIFLAAGTAPVVLAVIAVAAAGMRGDELAHPLR